MVNPLSMIAGAACIFNLGISQDLLTFGLIIRFVNLLKDKHSIEEALSEVRNDSNLLYLPSGNVLFTNNQVALDLQRQDMKGRFSFYSQLIVSLDDVAYSSNQSECRSFLYPLNIDVAIVAVTIRANDNRFQEGACAAICSLFTFGFVNSTINNQAAHCLFSFGAQNYTIKEPNTVLWHRHCRSLEPNMLQTFHDTLASLDLIRSQGLARMKVLQEIKNRSLTIEKARLEKKYGAGHPRVTKIADRIEYNVGAAKELAAEIERSAINVPDFDQNTWMAHGQIVNKDGCPVPGVTVSLRDEHHKWIKELGYTNTNHQGYYALRYRLEPEQTLPDDANKDLYLTVSDSNHKLLHCESKPMRISIGRIDGRQIVLTGETCAPPEPEADEMLKDSPSA